MSGTRKLEKFEPGALAASSPVPRKSGTQKLDVTQKLEKHTAEALAARSGLVVATPISAITPLMLAAARPSLLPSVPAEDAPLDEARVVPPPPSLPSIATSAQREPEVERLRTRLARKFTTLADEVTAAFVDFRIGAGAWAVELTAPEGMSTKGGKQALQYLRLRPTRPGHAVLVGGVVNGVERTAELRDHAHMEMIYVARFGRSLAINAGEWEQLLRKAEVVLGDHAIVTSRVEPPAELKAQVRARSGAMTKRRAAVAALAIVAFLATFVAWRVIVALSH